MVSVTGLLRSLRKTRKKSFSEILDDIDVDMKLLEDHKATSLSNAKKFKFHLFYYSSLFFGAILLLAYFTFRPSDIRSKLVFGAFTLLCPLLVWLLKYAVNFVFMGSVQRYDRKLKDLMNRKRKILMEVMDTQTYNRAQQILKRFDPNGNFQYGQRPHNDDDNLEMTDENCSAFARKRTANIPINEKSLKFLPSTNETAKKTPSPQVETTNPPLPHAAKISPVPHRPILPRERSVLDKLIDAMVGDGPDRRYALICQRCASHNGMALAEEFEYLAYRCCYCGFLNPARKLRRNSHVFEMQIGQTQNSTPISSVARPFSSALDLSTHRSEDDDVFSLPKDSTEHISEARDPQSQSLYISEKEDSFIEDAVNEQDRND